MPDCANICPVYFKCGIHSNHRYLVPTRETSAFFINQNIPAILLLARKTKVYYFATLASQRHSCKFYTQPKIAMSGRAATRKLLHQNSGYAAG